MTRRLLPILLLFAAACVSATAATGPVPAPKVDAALAATPGRATMVIAGGCFWGIQQVYQHVKGVIRATSGYSGGTPDTAHYEIVSTDTTGHAEAVEIVYDPSIVTYGQLLQVFFSVAHDPTELDRQGPDVGTQYRSVIFFANPEQQKIAKAYIAQLDQAKIFNRKIVTDVTPLRGFFPAEDYHQDYATLHPNEPYIAFNDAPKLTALQKTLPELYVAKKAAAK